MQGIVVYIQTSDQVAEVRSDILQVAKWAFFYPNVLDEVLVGEVVEKFFSP